MRKVENQKNDDHGRAADRDIDIETPPPRDILRQGSAQQRTSHRRDANTEPVYIGRLLRGTMYTIRIIVPEGMQAEPSPAIARPTINAIEVGVAPQSAEPISKTRMLPRKTHFGAKRVYSLPKTSWKAELVRRYAEPYQPTSMHDEL